MRRDKPTALGRAPSRQERSPIAPGEHPGFRFWGRPSPFQLWEDLQDLLRRTKDDFDPTTEQAWTSWMAANMTPLAQG